jgi:hypothetical protein
MVAIGPTPRRQRRRSCGCRCLVCQTTPSLEAIVRSRADERVLATAESTSARARKLWEAEETIGRGVARAAQIRPDSQVWIVAQHVGRLLCRPAALSVAAARISSRRLLRLAFGHLADAGIVTARLSQSAV